MSNSGVASLLIILGEPHYDNQIRPVLDRILEGLTVWDQSKSTVDLNTELLNFINKNVTPEKVEGGTILRSEGKVHIEILVHPTVALLTQWLQNFLYQPTPYKLIIHAGPVFQGTGSWILRDGTFSLHDFARFTHKNEIASVLKERSTDTSSTTTISCINEGEWNDNGFKLHELNKRYSISVQQKGAYDALQCTNNVLSYFNRYITYCDLTELMPSSNIVGSVRFRRPTIYMFPAGQGDAALFGVSGFTLLLDGGYQWKSCFWDFLRHVDRIDAMLVSRLNAGTINGARSFVKRLSLEPETHPKLGYAFMNAPSRQAASAAVSSPSGNPLLVSVSDQTFDVIESLAKLSLEPHPLSFTISAVSKHLEPLTLYQKVGHGRLEMYVLNPAKDSKELNEFTTNFKRFSMLHLHSGGQQATASPFSVKPNQTQHGAYPVPFTAQLSIAALIVWHPANAQENVIRVLYPGSCPQDRLLASLDKLKHLEFLKHSACTPASLESGRGVKGTPARKPAENNAKLLSPTPKPPSTVNNERHPITGTNLVRTSPVPPPTHHVSADQRQHHEAHAPADHHREPHGRVVDHEHHKDALLVDTQHHHQPQVSPQPKIDAVPISPKVETFLEASAPLMAASAEHSVPDEILEKHGMSAFAPPSGGRKHADNFHDEQQHGHDAHHESRSHHRGVDHHEEIHERGFIDRHEEAHERGFMNDVPHPHHHRNLMDEDLSGHKADHEISYPADDDLLDHRHVPKVAVCPAKPFDPHQHEKPLFESLETHSLRHTEDNTSDTASPLSPVASDDVHRRATKDSPVDPIQRPLLDLGGNADFVAHDTSPVDIFDHHHHPHQQHEHQHHQQQQQHSPLESPSSPGRPHSATRLNPDAPVFIPTHSIGSDDASADLLDSFGGGQQPKPSHSPSAGFSNGVHPDVPGGVVVDAHHEHHHHQQGAEKRSLDEMMKTFDGQMPGGEDIPDEELMKAWGKPLGAPPPPGVVVGPAAAKSMTSSSTTKKPAAAASSKTSDAAAKAKPSAAAAATSSAANKKPTAATAASSKQTNGTDNKPASAGAKKPAAAAAANKSSSQSPASKSPNATTGATAVASSKPAAKAPPPAKSAGLAAAAAKAKPPSAASSPASTKSAAAASAATKPAPAATKPAPAATKPAATAASATTTTKPAAGKSAASAAASGKKQPPAVGGPSYYVDLTYVPHNGNPHFVNADFFKAVRAKYYVLSSLQAPKETLEAFLAGKKAWNMPEEEVTLIPTYDSDSLNLWMSVHRDDLTVESIDVAPSCARCSLNLEEHHGTVCAAYRLEL